MGGGDDFFSVLGKGDQRLIELPRWMKCQWKGRGWKWMKGEEKEWNGREGKGPMASLG